MIVDDFHQRYYAYVRQEKVDGPVRALVCEDDVWRERELTAEEVKALMPCLRIQYRQR